MPKTKEEIRIAPASIPPGSRFKGCSSYSIQEMVCIAKDVVYHLEAWETPDGSITRGTLPKEIEGSHFGPGLRAMIHALYASGVTQPALLDFLQNCGVEIAEGQVHNILVGEAA